jgi:hypothetical protein
MRTANRVGHPDLSEDGFAPAPSDDAYHFAISRQRYASPQVFVVGVRTSRQSGVSLAGTTFAAAKKLVPSVGVACVSPDIGTCATTDFQYLKNKTLHPTPLTLSHHLRRAGRRYRVFGSRRGHHRMSSGNAATAAGSSSPAPVGGAARSSAPALTPFTRGIVLSRPPKSSTSSSFASYKNSTKHKHIFSKTNKLK